MANKAIKLYKELLRTGQKFDNYNYRNYALRKIKTSFRENKDILEAGEIEEKLQLAEQSLQLIKRQTTIGQLYSGQKLVIE